MCRQAAAWPTRRGGDFLCSAVPVRSRFHYCYTLFPRPSKSRTAGAGTDSVTADRKGLSWVNSVLAFTMLLIVLVVVLHYVK
jgi:hypothetical protein